MCVLIVDDEELFVTETAELLRNKNLRTLQAHSFRDAERVLHEHSRTIAVALVDMFMGTDHEAGLNLIRLMRREYPSIVPIVLTGHATLENAAECIEAGAAQYLLKDMCPPLLALATVKQALQRSDQDRLQREKDQLQFQKAEQQRRLSEGVKEALDKLSHVKDIMEILQRLKDEISDEQPPSGRHPR